MLTETGKHKLIPVVSSDKVNSAPQEENPELQSKIWKLQKHSVVIMFQLL